MHNHTFRIQDVAQIIEDKIGRTVVMKSDGQHDAKLVLLSSLDIAAHSFDADKVYFGDFVIEGQDPTSCVFKLNLDGNNVLNIEAGSSLAPVGNILPCLLWDSINNYASITAHFYGWEINLVPTP